MAEEKEKDKKTRFSITMSGELVKRIDEERSNIPRSTFIEYKLRQSLGPTEVSESMKASKEKKQAEKGTESS